MRYLYFFNKTTIIYIVFFNFYVFIHVVYCFLEQVAGSPQIQLIADDLVTIKWLL